MKTISQAETKADILLAKKLKTFDKSPSKFVLFSFPWGKGQLQDYIGPEDWQWDLLLDIENGLKTPNQVIHEAVASGHGVGKLQAYDDIVPTPKGMTRWGSLKTGDCVFGKDGNPTKILQCHHYFGVPMYRVRFDDGSYCDVSSGHLWNVRGRQQRRKKKNEWLTLETIEILNLGVKRLNGVSMARQWEIPVQEPVKYEEKEVPIHPYLMGVWIGDGSRDRPAYTKYYTEVEERINDYGYETTRFRNGKTVYIKGISKHTFAPIFDKRSHERYIPDEYKFNSIENRCELFKGLCDTDGECTHSGSIEYSTTSKQLAEDVVWLARSLGCKSKIRKSVKKGMYKNDSGESVICRDCYRVAINCSFNPFSIKHKRERFKVSEKRYLTRWIESIKPIGNNDGMCISIENMDGLYQAKDFIVTHNSTLVAWLILWALSTKADTRGIVTANTDTQLRTKTWPELAKWHNLFVAKHFFTLTATSIYSSDKDYEKVWRIDIIPWSEHKTEAFAGLHNKGKRILVIFDEASAIPNVIWEVTEGALTDENTEIIWAVFGNPTRNTGRFRECFSKYRHRWNTHRVDSRQVKITNKAQIDQWLEDYGEDSDFFKVRVRGDFPALGDMQFISSDIVQAAKGRHLREDQYNFAAKIIGVDPGWSQDEGVIYLRQGLMSKKLMVYRGVKDDLEIAGQVAKYEDEYKADAVFIDLGYGTGIYSAGKQLGRRWKLVPFGGKSTDDGFLNKRADMWRLMRDWIKDGGALEDDPIICDQLTSVEAGVISLGPHAGKVKLESKDEMAKRGIESPSRADALCLTFAFPVKSRAQKQYQEIVSSTREYDPLKVNKQSRKVFRQPSSPIRTWKKLMRKES